MMPKYLFRASLAAEGVAGVLKEGGSARRQVVKDAVEKLGGTLETFYSPSATTTSSSSPTSPTTRRPLASRWRPRLPVG